jgi:hypothetical protein
MDREFSGEAQSKIEHNISVIFSYLIFILSEGMDTVHVQMPIWHGFLRSFIGHCCTVKKYDQIPGLFLTKPSRDWDWVDYSRPGKVW